MSRSGESQEHHLTVSRTARYALIGTAGPHVSQVWVVCHGFGQLARSFIREFTPIARADRLIVAPEALSRFYLGEVTGATSATARVGATWMTREDRLSEISDYVGYLDTLYHLIFEMMPRDGVAVTALGFSQGVATAARWAALGAAKVDRVILWGGRLPDEFATAEQAASLKRTRMTMVVGREDQFLTGGAQREERDRLAVLGLDAEWLTFDGGHAIDRATLLRVAEA